MCLQLGVIALLVNVDQVVKKSANCHKGFELKPLINPWRCVGLGGNCGAWLNLKLCLGVTIPIMKGCVKPWLLPGVCLNHKDKEKNWELLKM